MVVATYFARVPQLAIAILYCESAFGIKEYIHVWLALGGVVGWVLILSFLDYGLMLRTSFFHCLMILLDLWFIDRESSVVRRDAWVVYLIIVGQAVTGQFSVLSFYYFAYYFLNLEVFEALHRDVITDLCLFLLMAVPFHLIFDSKLIKKKKKAKKSKKVDRKAMLPKIDFEAKIQIVSDVREFSKSSLTEEYKLEHFRRIPTPLKNQVQVPPNDPDTVYQVFNLNSKSALSSKDFILAGRFHNRPGIRYVASGRASWDLTLSLNQLNHLGWSTFIQNVWINNQKRTDMVAYYEEISRTVIMASLNTRKVLFRPGLFNPYFPLNDRSQSQNIDFLAHQPGLNYIPYLIVKNHQRVSDINLEVYTDIIQKFFKQEHETMSNYYQYSSIRMKADHLNQIQYRREKTPEKYIQGDYFENLAAFKVGWINYEGYEPDWRGSRSQMVYIMKIEKETTKGVYVACLDKITEGVLGGERIDFLTFIN